MYFLSFDYLTDREQSGISLLSIVLLLVFKRFFYEFFAKSHYFLALFLASATWHHLFVQSVFASFYIIIAVSILLTTTMLRYARVFLRSITWNRLYATTNLISINDVIRAEIEVTGPWKVKAGDFIYIWMPGVSPWSSFQSHPFMISWWDEDATGRGKRIHLLLKPRSGFTQRLMSHIHTPHLKTWIDGPYGIGVKFESFGRVMMFASGIGIAAQIPFIKELLRNVEEYRVCTRKILLIWQLDKESKYSDRSYFNSRLIS